MSYNFNTYYIKYISNNLKSIDILIKSNYHNIDNTTISKLLYLSNFEIEQIKSKKQISTINSDNIIVIMLNGTSYICKIFRRTLNINNPVYLTANDISYIYNIDKKIVNNIFDKLEIKNIHINKLNIVFKNISYKSFPLQLLG